MKNDTLMCPTTLSRRTEEYWTRNGYLEKNKIKWANQGSKVGYRDAQKYGIDYRETFLLIVKYSSIN